MADAPRRLGRRWPANRDRITGGKRFDQSCIEALVEARRLPCQSRLAVRLRLVRRRHRQPYRELENALVRL
jgi:hypothetical protein